VTFVCHFDVSAFQFRYLCTIYIGIYSTSSTKLFQRVGVLGKRSFSVAKHRASCAELR